MSPTQQQEWQKRRDQLEARARKIYRRLVQIMPSQEVGAIRGVPLNVPLHGEMSWAAANYKTREITVDLGCFWDLPDDCLGYSIGHEIGHFVYEAKNPKYWQKRIPPSVSKKLELDADVYGALLAYRLGYDPKLAFNIFTREEREAGPSPLDPGYPTVKSRQSNMIGAIKKDKDSRAAAKIAAQEPANVPADQQGNQPSTELPKAEVPPTSKAEPTPDLPLSNAAQVDLAHSKHGIEVLLAMLNQDPQVAIQMFPGSNTDSNTAYA
jgi:hypothetical protein